MQSKEQTASYVELSSQTYSLFVDALASANKRSLDYVKALYEITSRPYTSSAVETTVRENFDRANQIINLTIGELQTNGQKTTELGEKVIAHGAKIQESMVSSMKGLVDTSVSNLNFAKESATASFDDMAKRIEEVQSRTAQTVSSSN